MWNYCIQEIQVKAKNFIILIYFYSNKLVITPWLFPSLFLFLSFYEEFFKASKEQEAINEI